jgi:chemotaxis protein histidine kinase CheA
MLVLLRFELFELNCIRRLERIPRPKKSKKDDSESPDDKDETDELAKKADKVGKADKDLKDQEDLKEEKLEDREQVEPEDAEPKKPDEAEKVEETSEIEEVPELEKEGDLEEVEEVEEVEGVEGVEEVDKVEELEEIEEVEEMEEPSELAESDKTDKPDKAEKSKKPAKPAKVAKPAKSKKTKTSEKPKSKSPKKKKDKDEKKDDEGLEIEEIEDKGETEGKAEEPQLETDTDKVEADLEDVKEAVEGEEDIAKDEDKIHDKDRGPDEPIEPVEPDEPDEPVEPSELDKLLSKIMEYNDFVPVKDTVTVIAHLDVDGVLCVAAINKMLKSKPVESEDFDETQRLRVFFTSPTKIFNTLAKSIPDLNKVVDEDFCIGELHICDLSIHRDTLLGSSIYDQVKWFDHHEYDPDEQFDTDIENIELVIDPTAESAAAIVCKHFKLDDELGKIADEVDQNNVSSENAKRIREIVGALRLRYSGTKLKKLLFELAKDISEDINAINNDIYDQIVDDYNKWLEDFSKYTDDNLKLHTINGHKIGILETENAAPVYSINDKLKNHPEGPIDILTVMIHKFFRIGKDRNNKFKNKKYTKLEFRTHTDQDLLDLAKLYGGGGHKFASGATVMEGVDIDELLRSIETFFTAPPPSSPSKDQDKES